MRALQPSHIVIVIPQLTYGFPRQQTTLLAQVLNEMIRQRVRPAELARRMQTTPQEVNRLTNIRHTSRIDGIAGAMKALGKTLEIRAV